MNRFLRNLYLTFVGTVAFLAVFTLLAAYVWHQGAFRWAYQFIVSAGLLACAFYFLLLSKGNAPRRIGWGLAFLILSPIFYVLCNAIFWGQSQMATSIAGGSLRFGGELDLIAFIMEAQIAPAVPVLLLALFGFMVGNAIFVTRNVGQKRLIGGNLLLLAWTVLAYWMAYVQG